MGICEGFLLGLFGRVLAELLGLFRLRHQARQDLPLWLRSPFHWTLTVMMILSGGGLVVVYLKSNIVTKSATRWAR
jgi:hypothetical protein